MAITTPGKAQGTDPRAATEQLMKWVTEDFARQRARERAREDAEDAAMKLNAIAWTSRNLEFRRNGNLPVRRRRAGSLARR
jgi:hypothetical protein